MCHILAKEMFSGCDFSCLSSGLCPPLLFFLEGGKNRRGFEKGGGVGLDDSLCAVFEVLVCIVQELEESRSFRCGETSDCSIILVRMIFVGELLIVDFNFGFRHSESETKNRE